MKKTVISITGIRPDFIRMKNIFHELDKYFNHILIHTGQHYSEMLSDVFFDELSIRKPDYNLSIGSKKNEHFHQLASLSVKLIDLIREKKLKPDCIIFLGDSNSVASSLVLKKEGYKIAHIEAGMRSYDKRMLEEINRLTCDHCSDLNFVYHRDYKTNLLKENIHADNIYIIGNTILEIVNEFVIKIINHKKKDNMILADIHRPENFNYPKRLKKIIKLLNLYSTKFNLPVYLLNFSRTIDKIKKYKINIKKIKVINLMSYNNFLKSQYNSYFVVSDSGTAQEETPLLKTPVITPRDFTERPQSMINNCSYLYKLNHFDKSFKESLKYIISIKTKKKKIRTAWLGKGNTSKLIVNILRKKI